MTKDVRIKIQSLQGQCKSYLMLYKATKSRYHYDAACRCLVLAKKLYRQDLLDKTEVYNGK